MTRINLIDPAQLCDKHLMAEYRELIRIPNGVLSGTLKAAYPDAPKEYKLGAGHIKFFVDKLVWLAGRQVRLHNELLFRGFKVEWMLWGKIAETEAYQQSFRNWYTPTQTEIQLNIDRIIERMPAKPRWTNRDVPAYWNDYLHERQLLGN